MSWQTYVDQNLVALGQMKQAAILGLDGSCWAASPGFVIPEAEGVDLVSALAEPSTATHGALKVSGYPYPVVQITNTFAHGLKKAAPGQSQGPSAPVAGLCVAKSTRALVVGLYDDTATAGSKAALVVEGVRDFLVSIGY
eukprot:NODE_2877_length_730_cov_236.004405_g2032_i0.p1 GENE.NODE_2877_length_730_cov_236.004405_g2032_i0~~NODE_2877_length_730_cov_236.004405_g2032_i0.p1  ORF type:complete len:140 (+),score=44.55 NODE_2877_length_730_cov_236.004405_g2032_i0:142-561(+)